MMIFKKSDVMDVASEKAIFNTNPAYNLIAFDKNGFAKRAYVAYENMMKEQEVDFIQIAVHAENEKAMGFWQSLGFCVYDERVYEGEALF